MANSRMVTLEQACRQIVTAFVDEDEQSENENRYENGPDGDMRHFLYL